jgi:hypothetical protein
LRITRIAINRGSGIVSIDGLLSLLSNPFVAALLGTLLGPLLSGIPGFKSILTLMAGLAGYDLVPKVKPAAQPQIFTLSDGTQAVFPPRQGLLDGLDLSKILPFLLIGGVLFLMMSGGGGCGGGGCVPKPVVPVVPVPQKDTITDHVTPSAELQILVGPVRSLAAAKPDAAKALAPYYEAGADVIRRDGSLVTTTGQARQAKIDSDALYLQRTPLVGSLPGIGAATDTVLAQSVGLDDKPLDVATRARLADTLDAISWALGG